MAYNSKYHSENELEEIQKWEIKDTHNLINKLRDMWQYKEYFIEKWIVKDETPILILELHTVGWSGNEDIIFALEMNKLFFDLWWWKIEVGGHYYFKIDYSKLGFKTVSQFTKDNKISRQYIHKVKEKFEWIIISHGKRLIRKIKNN